MNDLTAQKASDITNCHLGQHSNVKHEIELVLEKIKQEAMKGRRKLVVVGGSIEKEQTMQHLVEKDFTISISKGDDGNEITISW